MLSQSTNSTTAPWILMPSSMKEAFTPLPKAHPGFEAFLGRTIWEKKYKTMNTISGARMNIYNKGKAKTNNWSFGDLGPFFPEIRNSSTEMHPECSPPASWNILQCPTTSPHKRPRKWRALKLKLHCVHFMGSPPQPLPKRLNLFQTFQTKARSQGQREIVSSPIGQKKRRWRWVQWEKN